MKHFNTLCVVLNICYLVGNYSSKTKQFGEVFYELANGPFGVYISYLQIYLRMFFNLLKLTTEVVIENCLRNKSPSMFCIKQLKQKCENILFSLYCNTGKILLNYLNVIMSNCSFEHVFFTYRPGINYNEKSLPILNSK